VIRKVRHSGFQAFFGKPPAKEFVLQALKLNR
jgi:hypothetical protein